MRARARTRMKSRRAEREGPAMRRTRSSASGTELWKLSTAVTPYPCSSSRSTVCVPMNPAPPVTSTLLLVLPPPPLASAASPFAISHRPICLFARASAAVGSGARAVRFCCSFVCTGGAVLPWAWTRASGDNIPVRCRWGACRRAPAQRDRPYPSIRR
jgi:hypothetical protein